MLGKDGRLYDPSFDFDHDGSLNGYEYLVMEDVVFGSDEEDDDREGWDDDNLYDEWKDDHEEDDDWDYDCEEDDREEEEREENDGYYAVKDVKQADEIKESDSTFSGKKPPAFFMKMAMLYADKSKGEQEVVEYAEVIMLVFKILGGIAIFLFLFWIGSELLLSLD